LSPFPRNLGDLLRRFDRVLVPEMNRGQLVALLRAAYLVPAERFSQVNGKPPASSGQSSAKVRILPTLRCSTRNNTRR
ncbi:MAG: hypothetical protein NTZ98_09655, partial [Acidobacteria bacterium]|nr:hypothetical protein [Acidobacteriota bacterium]